MWVREVGGLEAPPGRAARQGCAGPQTKLGARGGGGGASETRQPPPGALTPHLGAVSLPKSTCCQASISHPALTSINTISHTPHKLAAEHTLSHPDKDPKCLKRPCVSTARSQGPALRGSAGLSGAAPSITNSVPTGL